MRFLRNMVKKILKIGLRFFKAFLRILGLRSFVGRLVRRALSSNTEDSGNFFSPSNESQELLKKEIIDEILEEDLHPEDLIDAIMHNQKTFGKNKLKYEFISEIIHSYYFKKKSNNFEFDSINISKIGEPFESFPAPTFSVSAATRFVNNIDHKLPTLLYCLFVNALAPMNFEVLLAVDEDDDLTYFKFLQVLFKKKLNIRVIVGETNRGYRNLHHIQSDVMLQRFSSSAGVFSVTDDTCINKKYWDIEMLALVGARPGEIYMAYPVPNAHATTHNNMDFSQFLAFLAVNGPRGFQFFLSSSLLTELKKLTDDMPGWGIYGNNFLSDSYFDILAFLSAHDYKAPLLVPMNKIGYMFEQSLSDHKEGGLFGDSPVFKSSLPLLYHAETLKIIKKIAKSLAEKINTFSQLQE